MGGGCCGSKKKKKLDAGGGGQNSLKVENRYFIGNRTHGDGAFLRQKTCFTTFWSFFCDTRHSTRENATTNITRAAVFNYIDITCVCKTNDIVYIVNNVVNDSHFFL